MKIARAGGPVLGLLLLAATTLDGYEIREFALPADSLPNFIIVGPDGSMWFTEFKTDQQRSEDRTSPVHPKGDVNADGKLDVGDVFSLINFLFAGGQPPA